MCIAEPDFRDAVNEVIFALYLLSTDAVEVKLNSVTEYLTNLHSSD